MSDNFLTSSEIKNISSLDAYIMLRDDQNICLIDVRTKEEWQEVGIADVENMLLLSLFLHSDKQENNGNLVENTEFISLIEKYYPKDKNLLFICRRGVRSYKAATLAIRHGYKKSYNIIDGFEGNLYGKGWKNDNLPVKRFISEEVL